MNEMLERYFAAARKDPAMLTPEALVKFCEAEGFQILDEDATHDRAEERARELASEMED